MACERDEQSKSIGFASLANGDSKNKTKTNLSSVDGTKIKYGNIHTAFSCLIFGLVKNSHLNVAQDLDGPASAAILVLKG